MSPRPDVSEERRNQILEAAVTVFAQQGFHESRMDDIARQAGLSKGALYLYYKSKDAIIAALLKYLFAQESKRLQAFVEADNTRSVRERIVSLTHQLTALMKWMSAMRPIAFEFYAVAGRQKEVRLFLRDYYREYRVKLGSLIQHGIERGEFRVVDAEAIATTLIALYEGHALLFFVDPQDDTSWAEHVDVSVQLLLEGLERKASSQTEASGASTPDIS